MERIISVTDLVRNAARIAKEIETEGTIYRITRGGGGSMVLVDNEYTRGGWRRSTRCAGRTGKKSLPKDGAMRPLVAGEVLMLSPRSSDLKLRLNPRAERQLAALPAPAAIKLVETVTKVVVEFTKP